MSKSILITGCSSGIGLCTAETLKKRGYQVFASARKAEDVKKLKAQGFHSVQLDVTDHDSIAAALETVLSITHGKLDALFNNAGYLLAGGFLDLTPQLIAEQFATNVFGPIELTRRVLPIMQQQGHGRIIQNSSILGVITLPYYGAYNASKFALEGFSQTLRQELRGTNVKVSLINPGPVESKLRGTAFQHYQSQLKDQPSTYQSVYQDLEKNYFVLNKSDKLLMQPASAVVKKVIHALESKHPHTHYFVGLPTSIVALAKRLLPDALLEWALAKI